MGKFEIREEFYLNDSNEYAEMGSCKHENALGLDLNNGELITIESSPGYAAENRQFLQVLRHRCNALYLRLYMHRHYVWHRSIFF